MYTFTPPIRGGCKQNDYNDYRHDTFEKITLALDYVHPSGRKHRMANTQTQCAGKIHLSHLLLTLWPPGRLLTALSIFPRSDFDGFYLQMSLSHGYLLQIRINQVREVSIVYCQWIVIAYGIPFHWKFFCKSGFKFSLWDFCHTF